MLIDTYSSARETHFHRPDEVGAFLAESALGSIAVMADTNPQLPINGVVPHLGTRLMLHQNYFTVLLVGIAVTYLLLFVLNLWFQLPKTISASMGDRAFQVKNLSLYRQVLTRRRIVHTTDP